jgi:hypothetical protein
VIKLFRIGVAVAHLRSLSTDLAARQRPRVVLPHVAKVLGGEPICHSERVRASHLWQRRAGHALAVFAVRSMCFMSSVWDMWV